MNAWEKTCDTWRLLAAEIDGSFTEGTVPLSTIHTASVEKQYKNWTISFQTTGHTITGKVSYVPLESFTLNIKRKKFDWTYSLGAAIPPMLMCSEVPNTGFAEIEYLYSITSNDAINARKFIGLPEVREVLINSDGLQDFLICSMKVAGIQTGSIFMFDLSRVFDRTQMKNRFKAFQESLDLLSACRLASLEAPQASNYNAPEENLFDRFNIFKKK